MDKTLSDLMQTFSAKTEAIPVPKSGLSANNIEEQIDNVILGLLEQDALSLGQLDLLKTLLPQRATT